ncbi:O-antigen ligase family protein, partial [Candidatus Shapirobacteria bacterium]|nr:O-antigen ligase family protein [Candidatus Shapirobacteria bacterium]
MSLRLNNFIKSLILGLVFFTPLIYNPANSELFEIPKMYFVYLITLIIITAHLFNHLQNNTPLFRHHPLNIPILLFLASQLIATIFSIDRHVSIFGYYSRLDGGLLSLLAFTSLFFITSNYLDDKFRRQLINFSLLSGITVAMLGIAQHFNLTQYPFIKNIFKNTPIYGLIDKNSWKTDVQARVFSTLGQPNWLAAYLCILLPFSLDRFFSTTRLIHKSYFLLLTSSFWLCLLFTKSKTGLIAAIISLGIYFVYKLFLDFKNNVLFINLKSYFILLIFLLLSLSVSNPIKDFFFPQKMINGSMINDKSVLITPSEDIRKIVWQGAVDLWKRYPVFGTGPETFAFSYYWTRPATHNLTSEWQFLYNKAHNEYLNYLATSGLIGLITYLLLIISFSYYV